MRSRLLLFCLVALSVTAGAQDRPIGYWRAHLPYTAAVGVVRQGDTLFCAAQQNFFTYNVVNGATETFSRIDGMADVGMSRVGYDTVTSTVILAYSNSNIDLYKNETFFNIPYLKTYNASGSKAVNDIYTYGGTAYLSTDIGILLLDLSKREVKETYTFTAGGQPIPIHGVGEMGDSLYAGSAQGVYKASVLNPNLQVFSFWEQVGGARNISSLLVMDGKVYASSADSLFVLGGGTLNFVWHAPATITHLDAGSGTLLAGVNYGGYGDVYALNPADYSKVDSSHLGIHTQSVETGDGSIYSADLYQGIVKHIHGGSNIFIRPNGPSGLTGFDFFAYNKDVWVAHGSHSGSWTPTGNGSGISHLSGDVWKSWTTPQLGDTVTDVLKVYKNLATGSVYAGSFTGGMLQLNSDGNTWHNFPQVERKSGELIVPVTGLTSDANNTIWINQMGAVDELAAMTQDGTWYHYHVPFSRPFPNAAADVLVDDNNLKWYFGPQGGGVIVYNDNNTLANSSDDTYRQLVEGTGSGGLPDETVNCLAKDKDGEIWIGTNSGVGVIACPALVIAGQCEATQPVVQYDQFAGLLFTGQQVNSIAVDGANRKWVATNQGLWLLSPTADKAIYYFTTDNSPLFSNIVQKVSVDPVTGDVYIGTDQGIMSYRSTATDGVATDDSMLVFPNPVPAGYGGTIAIKGLSANADVRITDVSGQLVYRTQALGGQAVWNGLDYTGVRPQTGVFLIFVTSSDGTVKKVGKMVFNH